MVFQWFSNMWTIGVNGFSMVFLLVNHWCQWFFNGFSDLNHWYRWFFQCFFYNQTIAIALMVCDSPLTSMVYQWFWGKWTLVHKKGQNAKKTWFVQQKHRNKQTLDRLTWPNVTKVSLGNHFSSILALWLPPLEHLQVFILTIAIEWMVGKPPLISMVLRWFLVSKTIGSNGFPMVFGPKTIGTNGSSMDL